MEDFSGYFRQSDLIVKFLKGELNDQEKEELERWIAQSDANQALFSKLTDENRLQAKLDEFATFDKETAWERIRVETSRKNHKSVTYTLRRSWQYAAAVLLVVGLGVLLYRLNRAPVQSRPVAQQPTDFVPGGDKAVLTLADASQIVLDDARKGEIARQEDLVITKTADGQLVYNVLKSAPSPADRPPVYNTITTPRGGRFRVVLPDGSKVWLNAASSLRYPTKFWGTQRTVELAGEAYFEIVHTTVDGPRGRSRAMPFRVHSAGQIVEVLGTHFNINSYADERSIKTTLLEGSVKVIRTAGDRAPAKLATRKPFALILKPGEQVQLTANAKPRVNAISRAGLEEAVAWKNGQFQFRDTDLQTIMRQIARWYDVEVEFQGKVPATAYRGKISRDVPLSQILQILQTSGVNFKIEGRKITVKT